VIEHAVKAQLRDLRAASDARAERLETARAKERKSRAGTTGAFRTKRSKVASGGEASGTGSTEIGKGDEQFLPEDKDKDEGDEDGVYLSKEVRDLMAKLVVLMSMRGNSAEDRYEASRPMSSEEEVEEDVTKVAPDNGGS